MIFLHITTTTSADSHKLDEYIKSGKHVFVLIYMEGCGPCIATRPEWEKLKHELESKYASNDNVVVADVDKDTMKSIKNEYLNKIDGFPCIKYVHGDTTESYEECTAVVTKNRSVDSFISWIESKIEGQQGGKKCYKHKKHNKQGKQSKGRSSSKSNSKSKGKSKSNGKSRGGNKYKSRTRKKRVTFHKSVKNTHSIVKNDCAPRAR